MRPTRISLRQSKSLTMQNQAAAFRTALFGRHPACVISGNPIPELVTASHLIPKRLGDAATQSIFTDFTGLATSVARYEFMGITLCKNLDALVDNYHLGFWHKGGVGLPLCMLCCVNILRRIIMRSMFSLIAPDNWILHRRDPPLFHHLIIIDSRSNLANPPPGVFACHYTQCVLMKFATEGLANINHFNLPRMMTTMTLSLTTLETLKIPHILRICWILLGRGDVRRWRRQNDVET